VAISTIHFWKADILGFLKNSGGRGSLIGENALPWQPGVKFWRMHLMI